MSPANRKQRFCSPHIRDYFFKPQGVPMGNVEIVELSADELEAMRICDIEDLEQEKAAEKMGISRGTVQRLLYSGRKKVAQALLSGKAIHIVFPENVSFVPTPSQGPGFGRGRGFGRRFRGGR